MSVSLSPVFNAWQGFTDAGLPLSGGLLSTYQGGTIVPQATYTTVAGNIANSNPIQLDTAGRPPQEIWLTDGVSFKFVLTASDGTNPKTYDFVSGSGGSVSALIANLATASGSTTVGWEQGGSTTLRTVSDKLREVQVTPQDFGAKGDNVNDDTSAIQTAVNYVASLGGGAVVFPAGTYKVTSTVSLLTGASIRGAGPTGQTTILAYGCDAFSVPAGGGGLTIEKLFINSNGSPLTQYGIKCLGTNASHVNYVTIRDCYFQGWYCAVYGAYFWNSVLDNVTTQVCNRGLILFGQSCNNAVNNSRLVMNAGGGSSSIVALTDTVTSLSGEGLMVTNTLLAVGDYGVIVDNGGFLAMQFSNCITDQIGNTGFSFTGIMSAFQYVGGWVAVKGGNAFYFGPLASLLDVSVRIDCYISVLSTAINATCVYWGANNQGLALSGSLRNSALTGSSSNCLTILGNNVVLGAAQFFNLTPNASISVASGATGFQPGVSGGLATIAWATNPIQTVASAATITLPVSTYPYYNISGTTNITSIVAGQVGTQVTLRSLNGVTLVNGSNLLLNANIVLATNQHVQLITDGTNWFKAE